ncbi:hypothetical protein [Larkinella humicola]|uniref:Uncharacterized protein n=1 Tax=Larkinella humicola TaxID=2607654 RepID=A0A5N1JTY3_9BACT|nr:hypothetical protein [Larkinella humicola]KAA9357263.1 hypothetical protein F0P93_05875 [Larkinella humicola]
MKPTLIEVIEELEYELRKKQEVFPAWVRMAKMTQKKADHRIACQQEAIRRMKELQAKGEQTHLFVS